ncbi:hypothetical protein PYW07_012227 [Mythimna separata]|uniref:Uncharacterized protein n=1 Tax=Mythimna separata TaxID=271217 RepID=A0AAD7YML0_MYTSE|nr:hypothetical protein PYW07_012227 [Mythimna separata]
MIKFSVVCLSFVVVAVHFWNVKCMTKDQEQEIIKAMKPLAEECASYCGLKDEDLKKYQGGDDMNPCFKKCMMQKLGLLDQEGKYDKATLHETMSQYGEDKEKAQKIEDQIDSCFMANADNNGDDEEAIKKRVDVMFNCIKELKE